MINSVALTGRLTKDVDLRTTQSGISVASFTLAVSRQYSKNKEAAEMFINYMCEPSVGLANCDYIGYSTPITAVWEQLDDDLKYNEIAYPGEEVMSKAEVFTTLPDEINAALDSQWSEMKSYEEGGSGWMVVVLLALALVISFFNIWRKLRKKVRDDY